jgi:hypothetical protein
MFYSSLQFVDRLKFPIPYLALMFTREENIRETGHALQEVPLLARPQLGQNSKT